jgi:hypothetical protein
MSLQLSFNTCITGGCKSIAFSETTGVYSAINTTGYGDPNPLTSDFNSATLVLTFNDVDYTFDLTSSGFPTSDETKIFVINPSDIGQTDKISDGIYYLKYTISGDNGTYFQTGVNAFYCNAECCVNQMLCDIDVDCECSTNKLKEYIKATVLLEQLECAGNSDNVISFNNALTVLNKICKNKDCGCK